MNSCNKSEEMMYKREIFIKLENEDIKTHFPNSETLEKYPYIFNIHFLSDYLENHPSEAFNQLFDAEEKSSGIKKRNFLSEFLNKKVKIDKIWKNPILKEKYSKETCVINYVLDKTTWSNQVVEQFNIANTRKRIGKRQSNGVFFSVLYLEEALNSIPGFSKNKNRESLRKLIIKVLDEIKKAILNPENIMEIDLPSDDRLKILDVKRLDAHNQISFGDLYESTRNNQEVILINSYLVLLEEKDIKNLFSSERAINQKAFYIVSPLSVINYWLDQNDLSFLKNKLIDKDKKKSVKKKDKEIKTDKDFKNWARINFKSLLVKWREKDKQNVIDNSCDIMHIKSINKRVHSKSFINQLDKFSSTIESARKYVFYDLESLIKLLKSTVCSSNESLQAMVDFMYETLSQTKEEITLLNNQLPESNMLSQSKSIEIIKESKKLQAIRKEQQQANLKINISQQKEKKQQVEELKIIRRVFVKLENKDITCLFPNSNIKKEKFPYIFNILGLIDYWDRIGKTEKIENIIKLSNHYDKNLSFKLNMLNIYIKKIITNPKVSRKENIKAVCNRFQRESKVIGFGLYRSEQNRNLSDSFKSQIREIYKPNIALGVTNKAEFVSVNYLIEVLTHPEVEFSKNIELKELLDIIMRDLIYIRDCIKKDDLQNQKIKSNLEALSRVNIANEISSIKFDEEIIDLLRSNSLPSISSSFDQSISEDIENKRKHETIEEDMLEANKRSKLNSKPYNSICPLDLKLVSIAPFNQPHLNLRVVEKYNIREKEDLNKLNQKTDTIYTLSHVEVEKRKLFISSVNEIGDALGVFAGETIEEGSLIDIYVGERRVPQNSKSSYVFGIYDDLDNLIEEIDAQKIRNLTAFINHSDRPNIRIEPKEIDLKIELHYFATQKIKSGEQLVFDYGPKFFRKLNFSPAHISSQSNWKTPEEKYLDNKSAYADEIFQLPEVIVEYFKLSSIYCIVPKYIVPLLNKDNQSKNTFESLLNEYKVNLPILSIENGKICESSKQQNLTALQLACFLGDINYIEPFYKYNHEVEGDISTLHGGCTALMALFDGLLSNNELSEKIALELLNKTVSVANSYVVINKPIIRFAFTSNQLGHTILHYAIKTNSLNLTKRLFEIAAETGDNLFKIIYGKNNQNQRTHADFDCCVVNNYSDMLKFLLDNISSRELLERIKKKQIFRPNTLMSLSRQKLIELKNILLESAHNNLLEQSRFLVMLDKFIHCNVTLFNSNQEPQLTNLKKQTARKSHLKISFTNDN